MFVLQRPQLPKVGWSMPEPSPDPDGKKLLDSAIVEQDYDSLPGLYHIERDEPAEAAPPESPPPAESPVPPPAEPASRAGTQARPDILSEIRSAMKYAKPQTRRRRSAWQR